jgi:threonine synthase
MSLRAWFRCSAGCAGEHPLDEVVYRCPRCGDLLEVAHDEAALAAMADGAGWRRRFDERAVPRAGRGAGVWAKQEWVAPHIRPDNVVTTSEGGSTLLPATRLGRELGVALWVKQCGDSHSGSFKDLGMTVLVSTVKQMIADGERIPAVACASTGDTSAALAAYAALAGIPAIVLLPRGKVSIAQLVQPLCSGATVLELDTDFDGCMRIVQQLAAEEGVYLANSMNSLRLEGQKTVALEIVQQLDWQVPDWIVIPGGNLGNVSALAAGLTMMRRLGVIDRLPRVCVAQAERANPLYLAFQQGFREFTPVAAGTTLASAIQIGDPVSRGKAIRALKALDGVVEQASEAELADAAARADRTGLFTCPQTGVALAAVEKLVAAGTIAAGQRVVVVSTASALKFSEQKARYHEGRLLDVPRPRHANRPVALAASYPVVRDAVRAATGG